MTRKLGEAMGKGRELEKSHREGEHGVGMMSGGQLKTWGPGPGSGLGGDQGGVLGKPCSSRAGSEQEEVRGWGKAGRRGGELDRRREQKS